VEPLILYHKGKRVSGDFSDIQIVPGDIFIVHGLWEKILQLKSTDDFMLITQMETEKKEVSKSWIALACFAIAIGLSLAGFPISIAFLTGAIAMVLTRVLSIDDAYHAVDWKVVFFLAGLIPLGLAMQKTGAASYLAEAIMTPMQGSHTFLLLLVLSATTTLFSLLMSNVGAAVILMPLVINIGIIAGIDPRPLVLLVAVSTANSFMLPTHQVNALLKSPGGYRNSDYIKAGWGITIGYLLITVSLFYLIFYS
jgi:di/tricarboxylate transporter